MQAIPGPKDRAGDMPASATSARAPAQYLFGILPPLFWAGNFFAARMFHEAIPPIQMSFWRWVLALAILLVAGLPLLLRNLTILRREWLYLAFLGAIGVTAFNCLIYVALHHTTVVNASLINSLMPMLTILIAFALIGDRLSWRQVGGLAVCLAGAMVVIARGDLAQLAGLEINPGDLLVLCGVCFGALYTVLIRWKPSKLPLLAFLAVTTAFGVVFHLPFLVWELGQTGPFAPTLTNLAVLIYLAMFPSLLAYIFWNRAVAAFGPDRTSMFMYLMPIFSTLLAMAFLEESFQALHLAGLILIFGGIALATLPVRRARP